MRTANRLSFGTVLDSASTHLRRQLEHQSSKSGGEAVVSPSDFAGIIFSGNPHETVPRRLLLDKRISPLERNAWQVFRLLINNDGLTAFPTYEELRPYLGMKPGAFASRETVAKALTVLRLTRWLSLGRTVRNELSGQVQGNVYILHDEPVSPAEATEMDQDYLQLLMKSLQHSNQSIRAVAAITWEELAEDDRLGGQLATRFEGLVERLASTGQGSKSSPALSQLPEFGSRTQLSRPEIGLSSDSVLSKKPAISPPSQLSSDSELRQKSQSSDSVRIPNSDSTYLNTNQAVGKKDVPKVPAELPAWLSSLEILKPEDRHKAALVIKRLPTEMQAQVVAQWAGRCNAGELRNPSAYLMKLVQQAIDGTFNPNWKPPSVLATPSAPQGKLEVTPSQHSTTGYYSRTEPTGSPRRMQTGKEAMESIRQGLGLNRVTASHE